MNSQVGTLALNDANAETPESNWRSLFITGGAAALLTVVFLPIQIAVFFIEPLPTTVTGWYALFQNSKLLGLLDLDLLLMVDQVLAILVFLALYAALRWAGKSPMLIGIVLAIVAAVLFIASNPAFAMLSLADQYTAAATDAQKAIVLAAGQTMLAMWQGSAFQASYILGSIAPILISVIMLRSRLFSRATAYLGILANVIALGLYVPRIGVYISIFSVVFLWIWYILLARGLFQLGQTGSRNFMRGTSY